MGVSICSICKDTVMSFICSDCLHQDIKNWLPKEFSSNYSRFHLRIKSNFNHIPSRNVERCFHCKGWRDASVCPFCYIVESYHWLKRKNKPMAKSLYRMLPLGSIWKVTELDGCVWKDGFHPMEEARCEKKDFGICDECGEYSDELVLVNREWICRECADQEVEEAIEE